MNGDNSADIFKQNNESSDSSSKKANKDVDSDEERAIENIKQNFSCTICLRLSEDPCIIPCGHIFCSNCLSRWLYHKNDSQCPKCRRVFKPSKICKISNGNGIRSTNYENDLDSKILRQGFSPQSMSIGNIIIYQSENKKPTMIAILFSTIFFFSLMLILRNVGVFL